MCWITPGKLKIEVWRPDSNECINEQNCTLIRFDIIQDFKNMYTETRVETIKEKALALIETETDDKYRKSMPVFGGSAKEEL
jgi:hypothetical protein